MWTASLESIVVQGDWMEDSYRFYTVYGVRVSNDDGRSFSHDHSYIEDKAGAERLLERIQMACCFDRFSPVDREHWIETRPVYGSKEYQRTGGDLEWGLDLEPELNPALTESQKDAVALGR